MDQRSSTPLSHHIIYLVAADFLRLCCCNGHFSCVFINLIVFFPLIYVVGEAFTFHVVFYYFFFARLVQVEVGSFHFALTFKSVSVQSSANAKCARQRSLYIPSPPYPQHMLSNCQPHSSLQSAPLFNRCACLPSVPSTMSSFFICHHNYLRPYAPTPPNTHTQHFDHQNDGSGNGDKNSFLLYTRAKASIYICTYVCVFFCVFASTHLMRTRWRSFSTV